MNEQPLSSVGAGSPTPVHYLSQVSPCHKAGCGDYLAQGLSSTSYPSLVTCKRCLAFLEKLGAPEPVAGERPKQRRGFRAMPRRTARAIHAAGGRTTAARYGSGYMAALGAKGGSRPKPRRAANADAPVEQ